MRDERRRNIGYARNMNTEPSSTAFNVVDTQDELVVSIGGEMMVYDKQTACVKTSTPVNMHYIGVRPNPVPPYERVPYPAATHMQEERLEAPHVELADLPVTRYGLKDPIKRLRTPDNTESNVTIILEVILGLLGVNSYGEVFSEEDSVSIEAFVQDLKAASSRKTIHGIAKTDFMQELARKLTEKKKTDREEIVEALVPQAKKPKTKAERMSDDIKKAVLDNVEVYFANITPFFIDELIEDVKNRINASSYDADSVEEGVKMVFGIEHGEGMFEGYINRSMEEIICSRLGKLASTAFTDTFNGIALVDAFDNYVEYLERKTELTLTELIVHKTHFINITNILLAGLLPTIPLNKTTVQDKMTYLKASMGKRKEFREALETLMLND